LETCILHLGSNVGNRANHIDLAEIMISKRIGDIIDKSKVYETEAWGKTDQDPFYNRAISVLTSRTAEALLEEIYIIESKMGRVRSEKWGPRVIDIDIIFYGQEIINNDHLIIPHSELSNRNFVLTPLMDICPDYNHPIMDKSVTELQAACADQLEVNPIK